MSPPTLSGSLSGAELHRLAAAGGLALEDADGTLLAGEPGGADRAPVVVGGDTVGWVAANGGAAAIARVVAELAGKAGELDEMAGELLDRYEEVTILYALAEALGSVVEIGSQCEVVLEKALRTIGAQRGYVALIEDGELRVAAAMGVERLGPGDPVPPGRGITVQVAETGHRILLHTQEQLEGGDLPAERLEAVLSVPVAASAEAALQGALGALTLIGRPKGERFSAGDVKLATAVAAQLAAAIQKTRLVDSQRDAERMQREVELAAAVQRSLLPAAPPELPGIMLAGRCAPAAKVGGDYYDFLTGDGGVSLLIADVSGHSIGSALMMAMARSSFRREIAEGKPPAEVLAAVNESLFQDLVASALFITAFCARYDPATRELAYANAGHNLPLLRRAGGGLEELDADGAALGILEEVIFEARRTALAPGDLLVLYTDGVVEARTSDGDAFGEERLGALVEAATHGPGRLADDVYAAVRAHTGDVPQQDDVTLVVLGCGESA